MIQQTSHHVYYYCYCSKEAMKLCYCFPLPKETCDGGCGHMLGMHMHLDRAGCQQHGSSKTMATFVLAADLKYGITLDRYSAFDVVAKKRRPRYSQQQARLAPHTATTHAMHATAPGASISRPAQVARVFRAQRHAARTPSTLISQHYDTNSSSNFIF